MSNYSKKKSGSRTGLKVLAVILALVIAAGIVLGCLYGFGVIGGSVDDEVYADQNSLVVTTDDADSYGISLTSVGGQGSSVAETLYVTLDGSDDEISWSVEFANPSSSWASGKSAGDYVKITPSQDTMSATVKCLDAFGEQIIITAALAKKTSVYATATADYVKKISELLLYNSLPTDNYLKFDFKNLEVWVAVDSSPSYSNNYMYASFTYTDGTIDNPVTGTTMLLESSIAPDEYVTLALSGSYYWYPQDSDLNAISTYPAMFGAFIGCNLSSWSTICKSYYSNYTNYSKIGTMFFCLNTEYTEYSETFDLYVITTDAYVSASSASLSESYILF